MRCRFRKSAIGTLAVLALSCTTGRSATDTTIAANDNRKPAGSLEGNELTVSLEARTGTWYPEGPQGKSLPAAAWAEPGKPMQNPGPLIRVSAGTKVKATLRNTLERPLTVFGFSDTHSPADSVVIAAGASKDLEFTANTTGTFYYFARSVPSPFFGLRLPEDTQLNGAIVVDPAGTPTTAYTDRVFLLSWWFTIDTTSPTGLGKGTMAINGLSWPHTERLDLVQGDSVRWRVINLTESDHPMHLHGFYFRMLAKADTTYTPEQQRLAVTEIINPFQTMSLAWIPNRPGNWIYHCHFSGHVGHDASLDTERGTHDESAIAHHGSDRPHQMFGLVMGIRVEPRGTMTASTREPRAMRLSIREKPNVYGKYPGYAFVLDGTPDASNPDALTVPGPTLVLEKDQPVAMTIVNTSQDRAAVHWHGIELESYPDGVPDWSGQGKEILPSIAPGDSLTVRFTPPRAGTFMYHSHFNEYHQINSGLYGAIVVVNPGERLDPETDRIMMFTSAGPTENVLKGPWTPTLLNGKAQPASMEFKAGTKYRLRLINITSDVNTVVQMVDGEKPVEWRAVAKDGATLPDGQATNRPAAFLFDPGEIYDFEYTPTARKELKLKFGAPDFLPPEFNLPKTVTVPVHVR